VLTHHPGMTKVDGQPGYVPAPYRCQLQMPPDRHGQT
jgi:hypothetical protein